MRISISIAIISLCICCLYACILNSDNDPVDSYPTIIYSRSDDEVEKLQSEFDLLNNNKIGTRLDQFGYTDFTMVYLASESSISDTNTVIQMAISALIKNSKFTNVSKESLLSVDRLFITPNNSWKIFFNEQFYKGLRVDGTTIAVYLNSSGVYRIDNHFFADIYIPAKAKYSESEVKESLIGKELNWVDYYHQKHIYTITDSSFSDEKSNKVIVPMLTDTQLEFRITWEIYIGKPGLYWMIYIDVITGEEIKIAQSIVD